MKFSPLVTVVISTYNQKEYLGQCLDVLVRDLADFNAEIVVADDCSTDGTHKIAEDFASRYPSLIRVLERNNNLGANLNYLRAHSAARGKYVAHIDGDDVAVPGKIQRQVSVMENDPCVNLVLHSAVYFSDINGDVLFTGFLKSDQSEWRFSRNNLACWGPIAVHSSFMYRRSSLTLAAVPFPFMEWSIAMMCLTNGSGIFINERLTRYRFNIDGQAWTATPKGRQDAYNIQWNNIHDFYCRCPELRCYLYAQVVVNTLALKRSGASVPLGMMAWLFKEIRSLRPFLIIDSYSKRWRLRPQRL